MLRYLLKLQVVNVPNSVTLLRDLLPVAVDMTVSRIKGVYNFVNPGTLSHNQILDLYKQVRKSNRIILSHTVR